MKCIRHVVFFIGFSIVYLGGCDADYSKNRIPERPEINEDFYKLSIAAIDQSIENSPYNSEVYYKKARILRQLENFKGARINIEKAIDLDKNNAEYHFFLADNLFQNNEFQQGLGAGLKARQFGMSSPELHYLLAQLYLQNKLPAEAFENNTMALENSAEGIYYFQQGEIFLFTNDTTAAINAYKKSLTIDTLLSGAYDQLTKLYIDKANTDSAAYYLKKHRRLEPGNLKIWFDQGVVYRLLNKDDSAKQVFQAIIAQDSFAARSMVKMSEIYFDHYKNDSAVYFAEKALGIRASLKRAMLMQGKVLARRKYFNLARQKFEEILSLDTANMAAKEALLKLDRTINYYRRLQKEREENMQIGTIAPKKIKPE